MKDDIAQHSRQYAKTIRGWTEWDVLLRPKHACEVIHTVATHLDAAADEIERLRKIVAQCRGMADQGTIAPSAAYRWCERIEEVCIDGPNHEYEEWEQK